MKNMKRAVNSMPDALDKLLEGSQVEIELDTAIQIVTPMKNDTEPVIE